MRRKNGSFSNLCKISLIPQLKILKLLFKAGLLKILTDTLKWAHNNFLQTLFNHAPWGGVSFMGLLKAKNEKKVKKNCFPLSNKKSISPFWGPQQKLNIFNFEYSFRGPVIFKKMKILPRVRCARTVKFADFWN